MADTEKAEPQTNGLENGLDEDERSKMRPADIDADVKEMERRKRVEMIMNSKLFREELERIIELQMKDGSGPAGLLQQISDMMGIQSGKLHTTNFFRGSNCVVPINDIRGVESMGYEKGEKNLRCKLASVFRLMDLYGWSQGINNQISARLNQDEEHFLVNAHGMLFNEITASSLVKVDMQGNIVEPGTTNFSVNVQGFRLHSAIHSSRPDVNCVIHIRTPSVLAVSSLKTGLLPLCQEAAVIGEVSQHPFVSGVFDHEELEKVIRNFGPSNKVLLFSNHGAVCCGATVEEAFFVVYNTVLACETQIKLMPMGLENLVLVDDETRKLVYEAAHRTPDVAATGEKKSRQFRVGEVEFEALIRMLDNAGFRTGYIYRHPLVKGEPPRPKNDVEVPPAVSSLGYLIEQEEMYKQGNWKKYIDGKNRFDRTKWLNSPNVYQKVEILETGTPDPKKITKWVDQNSEEWVAESSPTHSSTPVKIDSALQFVPKGTNPKEFKKLQQQIKENRRADKITSGPQSQILDGVSWEEAKKLQDANITHTGDQVILVGAASKGIIQRDYQHHALVYKTPYAKNPFDSMSDKEIEDYKQLVERKQRGDTDYEESQSESEALSSSRQDPFHSIKSPVSHSATSETEEESRDEPRVLRIETKTAPRPIQAEVVLSDAESDSTDARVARSHSARYPKAEKPESVNLMNSFRKSWSLKREKDKSKDIDILDLSDARNHNPVPYLGIYEQDCTESLHYCIARIKQLTYKPIIVDIHPKTLPSKLKSASDPCNLDRVPGEKNCFESVESNLLRISKNSDTSLISSNVATDLQRNLNIRKKLIHSAKLKFLGYNGKAIESENTSTSPMCALISEIRETINDIVSPERSKKPEYSINENSRSSKWNLSSTLVPCISHKREYTEKKHFRQSLLYSGKSGSWESLNDFRKDFLIIDDSFANDCEEVSEKFNCKCALHQEKRNKATEMSFAYQLVEKGKQHIEKMVQNVLTELIDTMDVSDDEDALVTTSSSFLPTYSFTETAETEWYYNKTILNLENSQTVLEVKEYEENQDGGMIRCTDTGIETDFTSEKEKDDDVNHLLVGGTMEEEIVVCDGSVLNKSSETDSSFVKSSGQTSNDVDTSYAFRTETENSDKNDKDKSPEVKQDTVSAEVVKNTINDILCKVKEKVEGTVQSNVTKNSKTNEVSQAKLPDIPESPEFMNIDTEDAPVTSSSKDTSPDVINHFTEEEPVNEKIDNTFDLKDTKPDRKIDANQKKKKKNKKSSTKITVKKERKEDNAAETRVSEIKLTITNSAICQSEKYEVLIQDASNTSEELSSSRENVENFETVELVERSCDCDAQQNLKEIVGDVSTTIEKLQTIEDYFENEIRKHSTGELSIEYNYGEFEDIMNESRHVDTSAARNEDEIALGNRVFQSSFNNDVLSMDFSDSNQIIENNEINVAENPSADSCPGSVSEDIYEKVQNNDHSKCFSSSSVDNIEGTETLEEAVCDVCTATNAESVKTEKCEEFVFETSVSRSNAIGDSSFDTFEKSMSEPELSDLDIGPTNNNDVSGMTEYLSAEDDEFKFTFAESLQSTVQYEQNSNTLTDSGLISVSDGLICSSVDLNVNHEVALDKVRVPLEGFIIKEETATRNEVKFEGAKGRHMNVDNTVCFNDLLAQFEIIDMSDKLNSVRNINNQNSSYNSFNLEEEVEEIPVGNFFESQNTALEEFNGNNTKASLLFYDCVKSGSENDVNCMKTLKTIGNADEAATAATAAVAAMFSMSNIPQEFSMKIQITDPTSIESEFPFNDNVYIENKNANEPSSPEEMSRAGDELNGRSVKTAEVDRKEICGSDRTELGFSKCSEFLPLVENEIVGEIGEKIKKGISLKDMKAVVVSTDQSHGETKKNDRNIFVDLTGSGNIFETNQKGDVSREIKEMLNEWVENWINENRFQDKELVVCISDTLHEICRRITSNEIELKLDVFSENNKKKMSYANLRELESDEYLKLILKRFISPLKEIMWHECSIREFLEHMVSRVVCEQPEELFEPTAKENLHPSVGDVTNFILSNEESPTNSLAEFEDLENVVVMSSSIVADIIDSIGGQLQKTTKSSGSDGDDSEKIHEAENLESRTNEDVFKVVIATPTKKEIFINYSQNSSTRFDLSSDFEFCNSYIKTDDINEDFENYSSDNCEFFAVGSSGNGSSLVDPYASMPCVSGKEHVSHDGSEGMLVQKSPRSLSIIQEVDEAESSTASEVCSVSLSPDM